MNVENPNVLISQSEKDIIESIKFLDLTYSNFQNKNIPIQETFKKFYTELFNMKRKLSQNDWKSFIEMANTHQLKDLLKQDPFTKRAFDKPRGYAGDAVMLDYIYLGASLDENITNLGREILNGMIHSLTASSARCRAQIIGLMTDRIAKDKKNIRVLSIACGHLRELTTSQAFMSGQISEVVAIDQDVESLEFVKNAYRKLNVTVLQNSVKDLLCGKNFDFSGKFDFVFASGLFDYLNDADAIKLTNLMFDFLWPGGTMLICNLMPHIIMQGYMEVYMHWNLVCRDFYSVEKLSHGIPMNLIEIKKTFIDKTGEIIFLEINKRQKIHEPLSKIPLLPKL